MFQRFKDGEYRILGTSLNPIQLGCDRFLLPLTDVWTSRYHKGNGLTL
ncbi:MAG: hypothetical protein GDA44_00865 [Prochloron sp. SP5CPC1]|nr:hypothetical protein [Candidatus Paraprochloron terpiosi SP5CPC1]